MKEGTAERSRIGVVEGSSDSATAHCQLQQFRGDSNADSGDREIGGGCRGVSFRTGNDALVVPGSVWLAGEAAG